MGRNIKKNIKILSWTTPRKYQNKNFVGSIFSFYFINETLNSSKILDSFLKTWLIKIGSLFCFEIYFLLWISFLMAKGLDKVW